MPNPARKAGWCPSHRKEVRQLAITCRCVVVRWKAAPAPAAFRARTRAPAEDSYPRCASWCWRLIVNRRYDPHGKLMIAGGTQVVRRNTALINTLLLLLSVGLLSVSL